MPGPPARWQRTRWRPVGQRCDAMTDQDPTHHQAERRRWIWGLVASGVLAAAIVLVFVAGRGREPDSRDDAAPLGVSSGVFRDFNLLLVSIDTLRADRVGCYGYASAETPVLDELARRGVRCVQAITSMPLTLPGHASMLTGLNPQHHEARLNGMFAVPDHVQTLAEILRKRGYRTAAVISAFVLDRRFGLAQGFEHYGDDLTTDGRMHAFGHRERSAEEVNHHVLAWLAKHGKERFFLWVHYFDPHFPYVPPEPFADRHKARPYDGEIAYADAQLGRLLAAVDGLGIRDRTLIVATSDHGEALGEHEEITHGLLVYDATLHVPLIFSGPAPLPQGRTLAEQTGLIDVVPTVLDLLGVSIPTGLDGISLLGRAPAKHRAVYFETLWPKVMHNWSPLVGVRRDDVKFILAPKPELYDLQADPNELNNLYAQRQAQAVELLGQLRALAGSDPETLATVSGNLPMDEETRQKLADLGYVVPSSAPTTAGALPDPKDMMGAWAEFQRGIAFATAGQHAEAVAVLEPFVQRHPRDARAVARLAKCYLELGRADDAARMFERQLSLWRRKTEPLAGLGLARIQQGRLDGAEEALNEVLAEDPQNRSALFGLGVIAGQRGQADKAMALFQRCIASSRGSQSAPSYYNVGVLHAQAGRAAEARQAFERALALDPHHLRSAQAVAGILRDEGRLDDAIQALHGALGKRTAPDSRVLLGQLLMAREQAVAAVAQFRLALKHHANHAGAHYELGAALRRLGQADDAIEHLTRCLKSDADHVDARYQLGAALRLKGRLDEARAHLERVIKSAPGRADAHLELGMVLAAQKRPAEARRALAEAVRLDPKSAQAHNALGEVLLQLGHREQAIAAFRQALELGPGLESARENLRRAGTQPAK